MGHSTWVLGFLLLTGPIGCASVQTESTSYGNEPAAPAAEPVEQAYPAYWGPKQLVQVVSFGIPAAVLVKYPDLAEKRVGFGLCNRIVEELYETNRFDYVEEKDAFLKRMIELWTAEEAGILVKDETHTRDVKAPDYVVYAEVFDFGVSSQERIVGVKKREATVTKIGVQIRFVDTKTMRFIPASATGESVREKGGNVFGAADTNFDETAVGEAAQQALKRALAKGLKRLDES